MQKNLKTLENNLVPVYETSAGEKVVDGRELHNVLQSKQDFSTWVKKRLKECDAEENIDYDRFHEKMEANNATMIEYIIKLDTAKEVEYLLNFLFSYSLIGFNITYRTICYIEIIKTLDKHIYV